jgi:predicted RNase H-like nuclease (RuvC/YqgF family)
MGVARLDYYFDPNERKYFISPQSIEAAIQEERAKALKGIGPATAEGSLPKDSETLRNVDKSGSHDEVERVRELEKEVLDLKITNRGKDYFIEQLQKERDSFGKERQEYVEKLMSFNRKVGELETKLLQLESPKSGQGQKRNAE